MKRMLLSSLVVLALMLAPTAPLLAKAVIGMVDIQKVLLAVDEGKGVRQKLEKKFNERQGEIQKEEQKFKETSEKFEKQKSVLNEKARTQKEQEMRELYMSLQNKTMEYQQELQDLEKKLKKPILDKIKELVEEISAKEGVDFTLEMGAAPVVYVSEKRLLTEKVIEAYNKKYPASAAK